MKKSLITVAIAVFSSLATIFAFRIADKNNHEIQTYYQNQTPAQTVSMSGRVPTTGPDFVVAAEKTVHAVVHIQTQYYYKNSYYDQFFGYDPFFNFFNKRNYSNQPIVTTGSGVLISENGYIVTNNHVVSDASKIEVTLNDKRTYTATVVGSDAGTDLALLKIEDTNLPFVTYGNSDDVKIGEWVLAVGNPFNLTSTVTAGIVSAKARDINIWGNNSTVESFIQTDAAINPGNSGGALVNINGELIGINAAIASNTGSYTGYSFAIPSNIVRKIISDILDFGDVQRAFLGVNFTDINSKLAAAHDIKDMKGVFVESVYEGGAADKAGIQKGDIIVKIDNSPITGSSELKEIIVRHRPGEKINVSVIRDNEIKQISLTLENSEGGTALLKSGEAGSGTVLGATLKEITDKEKIGLGLRSGVKIIKLEKGKLSGAGIREGLIITRIDNQQVKTTDDVVRLLGNKKGTVLIEGIYTNGMQAYFSFGL